MSSINILGSGIASSFSAYTNVRTAKEQEDAVAAAPDAVQNQPSEEKTAPTPSAPRNLMEGNFVQQNTEDSRYIQATLSGLKLENKFSDKMQGVVSMYSLQADMLDSEGDNYAARVLAGEKAARRVNEMKNEEVSEKETERMETERKHAEEEQEQEQEEKVSGESQDSAETVSAQEYIEEKSDQASGEEAAEGTAGVAGVSGPKAETAVEAAAPVQAAESAGTQGAEPASSASGVDQYV